MNFEKLFDLQHELDGKISVQYDPDSRSLRQDRLLALHVKIAELANETKCFKYWSDQKVSPLQKILDKYTDCIYFLLSMGSERGLTFDELTAKKVEYSLTDQFLNLYIDLNDFIVCSSEDQYLTLFEDFLSLGLSLGFSEKDIENTYILRYNINDICNATNY
ncbi:dUTP diphosphatase [Clostridium sp. 19966]|uniref:dUTP diphosphatase n=1 Tax=Clostridium sp. 19966 TaxID=2768166 RepID=UPI0028DE4E5D|nr:dUTP diphosphatase [Clostridium sp. 19966]MDT8718678.1 dUTP diphosphatase [Clostridium sp. 19966]